MSGLIKPRLPDLAACAAIAVFGLVAIWIGSDYAFGSISRMGAGFFPVVASVCVVALATVAAVETLATEPDCRSFKWRPLIFISVAIFAWAHLIDDFGIIPSTFALILISGLAKRPYHPIALVLTSAALCFIGYLVFVEGLNMPLTLMGR